MSGAGEGMAARICVVDDDDAALRHGARGLALPGRQP